MLSTLSFQSPLLAGRAHSLLFHLARDAFALLFVCWLDGHIPYEEPAFIPKAPLAFVALEAFLMPLTAQRLNRQLIQDLLFTFAAASARALRVAAYTVCIAVFLNKGCA